MRRWIRLSAAVGLAAAGLLGLSLSNRASHASAATPAALLFSHEVVTDEQRDGFEPDIQVAPHDTLYTSVPNGSSTSISWLWTSTDHGNSFHLVPGNLAATGRLINCPQGGGDTEEFVDPKGNLFFSDLQNLTNLTNSVSSDGGQTFLSSCSGADNTPVDRMWYAAHGSLGDPGFRIYEEYDAVDSSANIGNQLVLEASDNGVVFYPVVNPTAVQGGCIGGGSVNCVAGSEGISGNIVLAPNGDVLIAHSSGDGNLAQVTLGEITGAAVQSLQGSYRTTTLNGKLCPDYPVDAAHLGKSEICGATNFVTIAEDNAGNFYAAFASQQSTIENYQGNPTLVPSGPYEVYVVSSRDGLHWSDPVKVSQTGSNAFAWITAGVPGHVAVAWYSADETHETPVSQGFSQDLLNQQLANPDPHGYLFDELYHAEFNIDVAVSPDALSSNPSYGVTTASEHPVKYGPICTQGTLCEVTQGDRSLGDFMEVNHDARGALILSYVDDTSGYYVTGPTGAVGDNGPNVVVREVSGPNLLGGPAITDAGAGPGLAMGSVTDPAGDDFYSANGTLTPAGDNLDLTGASLSRDANGLIATIKVKSLSSLQVNPQAGGTTGEWIMRFTTYDPGHPGNGHIYYAGMESLAGGTPRFFAGEPTRLKDLTAFNSTTAVPGRYDAGSGMITIHIPFSVIGNHSTPDTTEFYSVTAFTATTVGSLGGQGQATPPVELFNQVDATTPFDYVLPKLTDMSQTAGTADGGSGAGNATSNGSSGSDPTGGPGSGVAAATAAAGSATRPGSHQLGFTGVDALAATLIATVLVLSGATLVLVSRKRHISVWEALGLGGRR